MADIPTMIADDVVRFLQDFGAAMMYTPDGGEAVSLTGLKYGESATDEEQTDGVHKVQRASLLITRDADSDVGGVADPDTGDTVVIGEDTWTVEETVKTWDAAAVLSIVRTTRRRVAAEGHHQPIARR